MECGSRQGRGASGFVIVVVVIIIIIIIFLGTFLHGLNIDECSLFISNVTSFLCDLSVDSYYSNVT
jgi:hypothetical protein